MNIFEHHNYRLFLKDWMAEKSRTNSLFSLRASAKYLNLAPSYLSAILKGEKNFSMDKAVEVAKRLKLTKKESDYFYLLVQRDLAKKPETREALLERVQRLNPKLSVNDLSLEHFRIISDPIHFCILVATELDHFTATSRQLSLALNYPQAQVELALDRLLKLEMIEKTENGSWKKVLSNPRVESLAPDAGLREFHRRTLQKAIESLETQAPREKIVGSETFAISDDQLEEFKLLTEDFFERALTLSKKAKKKQKVYHLGVQFFNMTENLNKKGERK